MLETEIYLIFEILKRNTISFRNCKRKQRRPEFCPVATRDLQMSAFAQGGDGKQDDEEEDWGSEEEEMVAPMKGPKTTHKHKAKRLSTMMDSKVGPKESFSPESRGDRPSQTGQRRSRSQLAPWSSPPWQLPRILVVYCPGLGELRQAFFIPPGKWGRPERKAEGQTKTNKQKRSAPPPPPPTPAAPAAPAAPFPVYFLPLI